MTDVLDTNLSWHKGLCGQGFHCLLKVLIKLNFCVYCIYTNLESVAFVDKCYLVLYTYICGLCGRAINILWGQPCCIFTIFRIVQKVAPIYTGVLRASHESCMPSVRCNEIIILMTFFQSYFLFFVRVACMLYSNEDVVV